jgi:energy-coupling factor transporter transmembrane protein EcfT
MILLIIIKNIFKSHNKENSLKKLDMTKTALTIASTIIINAGPFLFILFIISVLLYLLTTYKNKIIEGNISPSYGTFSNLIAILLLLLLYIIHTNITTEAFKNKGEFSLETSTVVYFLSILLWICTSIIYIVLYYYTTDCFTLMDLTKQFTIN